MSEIPTKKVLLVVTKSNFGGAQKYVYDLATSMPAPLFDVAVVLGEGAKLEEKLRKANIRTLKISTLQRNVNLFKDFSAFFELIRIFKKERPDVVHLNSTKAGAMGAVAGRICHVPKIIFTAHGWAFNEKRNFVSKAAIAFLQWLTVKLSNITIAVSQKTADQILKFAFVKKSEIKVVYNGATNINFVARDEARQELMRKSVGAITQGKQQSVWIGTISELHFNKGIDVALIAFAEVVKKYPQAIFTIIGNGQEKTRLANLIAKLNLTDRAFLIGHVDNAQKYLKAFDIFTLTSRTEALPYVILEAGLAELPMVASAVGGIPEIINSSDVGTLIPITKNAQETSRAFAEAIEKILANPEQAKNIGRNLRNRVLQEFGDQKMQAETFALYK